MAASAATRTRLTLRVEEFPFAEPFHISGHVFDRSRLLVAEVDDGSHRGVGEAAGVYYLGDDLDHMIGEAETARQAIERGATREDLQSLLPPGGARNAIDCALWDLDARRKDLPVWKLAGLEGFTALRTTMTIGAAAPEKMAAIAAGTLHPWPMLKLKLTGEAGLDRDRLHAVRRARPDAWIGVDANQGYRREGLAGLVEALREVDAKLLEQPLARGAEADLDGLVRSLPFAADESVCSLTELEHAVGRFDVVNIKLDKCGGLTEALAIAARCREFGINVMVGNMVGSSLSMAPAMVVGQLCDVVDLDGPTFLAADRPGAVAYDDGLIAIGASDWGLLSK